MSLLPPYAVENVLPHVFISGSRFIKSCAGLAPGSLYFSANDGSLMVLDCSTSPPVELEDVGPAEVSPSKRAIDRIACLPSINRLVVLATGGALSFHALPSLAPVSAGSAAGVVANNIVKGVLAFAIDDNTLKRNGVHVAIMKRKGVAIFRVLSSSVDLLKEAAIPTPSSLITAMALQTFSVCYADTSSYTLFNLATGSLLPLLPISQDPIKDDKEINLDHRPILTSIGNGEFLFVSHARSRSMGFFIKSDSGEPCRGTLEWSFNIRSLCVQEDKLVALTLNRTITLHNLVNLELLHTIELDSASIDPRSLVSVHQTPISIAGIASNDLKALSLVDVTVLRSASTESRPQTPEVPEVRQMAYVQEASQLTEASILLVCKNGLSIVRQPSNFDKAMACLHIGRHKEALEALQHSASSGEKGYINFKVGMAHVVATEFEEASVYLAIACDEGLDPRFLIAAYPDLYSKVVESLQTKVWKGALEDVQQLQGGMEKIIMRSLYKNYSPHIKPEADSQVLHDSLTQDSRNMLQFVLSTYREARWKDTPTEIQQVCLDALARLEAENGHLEECLKSASQLDDTSDLLAWLRLNDHNDILARLYSQFGKTDDLLDLWMRSHENGHPIVTLQQVAETIKMLHTQLDRRKRAFWLLDKDETAALSIVVDSVIDDKESVKTVYDKIASEHNECLADKFLVRAVLSITQEEPSLSAFLLNRFLAKMESFTASEEAFALAFSTPENLLQQMQVSDRSSKAFWRLAFIFFISTCATLDLTRTRAHIEKLPTLAYERGITYARLGLWRQALSTLAISAKDITSAEILCRQRTLPITLNVLHKVAKALQISVNEDRTLATTVSGDSTSRLMQTLIDILLGSEDAKIDKNSTLVRFITSQAIHLNVEDTLKRIPDDCSVSELQSFLERAFQRSLLGRQGCMLQKPLLVSQDLEISYRLFDLRRIKNEGAKEMLPGVVNLVEKLAQSKSDNVDSVLELK